MGLVASNPLRRFRQKSKCSAHRPVLPQELIDYVLDQLYDDHQTLMACLRVGRPFLARARVHIFSSVHVRLEPRRNTWKRFLRLFSSSPHLTPLVHTVHLQRNHQWPTECRFMSVKAVVRVLNSLVNLDEIKLQGYGPKIFRKKESMEAPLFKYLFADNRIKKVHLHNCKFFKLEDLFTFLRGFPEMKDLWIDKGFKCPVSTSAFSNNLLGESGTIYLETLRVISDFKNPFGILTSPKSPLSLKEMKALVVGTDRMELAPLLGKWISLFNTIQSECALRKVTINIFGFRMQQWPFHFVCDRVQWTRLDASLTRWDSLRQVCVNVKVHGPSDIINAIEETCCELMKKNLLHILSAGNSPPMRLF
ncbi:hypothetical protein IW262DRAFT_19902 [Armillaria fumosa]|nr:hypothetical protein IW262DRAFT_19902 [Armillaria fumosa]